MKKHIIPAIILLVSVASGVALSSCEDIDEVPPYKESSSSKAYKLPDPTLMTPDETAEYNAIRAEYEAAIK